MATEVFKVFTEESVKISRWLHRIRLYGVGAWLLTALINGPIRGESFWNAQLVPLSVWLGFGVLTVVLASHLPAFAGRTEHVLADPLFLFWAQWWGLERAIERGDGAQVALFSFGLLLMCVFVSVLTLRRWVAVAVAGLVLAGQLVFLVSVGEARPAWVFNTVLLAAVATGITLLAMNQLRRVLRSLAVAATAREAQLKVLVDERTQKLEEAMKSLKAAQTELVRVERMASVGTLVAGIAHELNNPIGFISGNVRHLKRYCEFLAAAAKNPPGAPMPQLAPGKDLDFVISDLGKVLDDVVEGSRRAKLIVQDLQTLATGPHRALEQVDLKAAVSRTLSLFGPRLSSLNVETQLEDVPALSARAGQMDQVITNLVDNASRAVSVGGHLQIAVKREGAELLLRVKDDGCGMSEELVRQVGEPFVTTRPPGEGSGLGLAVVRSIVEGHGGKLNIQSTQGKGTEVAVRLPLNGDSLNLVPA